VVFVRDDEALTEFSKPTVRLVRCLNLTSCVPSDESLRVKRSITDIDACLPELIIGALALVA
jgi:hypothetical protein